MSYGDDCQDCDDAFGDGVMWLADCLAKRSLWGLVVWWWNARKRRSAGYAGVKPCSH